MLDDKAMIEDPTKWTGDVLCLKRMPKRGEGVSAGSYNAFGVISSPKPPVIVYLRGPMLRDFENTRTYESVDAMLADGWIVD